MKYVRWFLGAVRPYRWQMAAMLVCHVLLALLAVSFVYVSKMLVDVAVSIFNGTAEVSGITVWACAMVGIFVVRIALNALKGYLQTKTEISLKNRLRYELFDSLLRLRSDGGETRHSGDVLSRMLEDVRVVSSSFAVLLPNLAGTMLQFAAAFVFLLWLDLRLALIVVLILPFGLFGARFITGRIRNYTLDIRERDSRVQAHLQESIQHRTLLQTLEYADTSISALGELQDSLYGSEIRRTRFSIASRAVISLAFSAGHAVAFLWGVYGISAGTVTYGMMTAFLQLVGQIQRPLMDMSTQIPGIIHATASIDRLMELEELPRDPVSEPEFMEGTAGVRFSDVSFTYPDGNEEVLKGLSYDFRPGSRTAIVGHTGVGKSTMIKILLALFTPKEGRVELYCGDRTMPVSVASRCNFVYVPQGNSLFSGTIRENLLMGDPDADEQRMREALHTAAADFVFELKDGLDTQCFESGAGLSEGQAQRIAVARALLRPGTILLLDEFSSALDAETETLMMERLSSSLAGHTMIFITHREKIIDYCDDVLRLG